MIVKPKITELLKHLNDGVYEKEEVIALSLLSAIAGESIFLLGAPGVAKSLIARRLKYAFKDGSSFEYLMNRFSTPDEIFGPVSISQLKDHDKYERIVKNYLPTATVVFLDEIWKAGPSIQNALLTVLNEKIYRNGEQEIKVPMKALISASNELPSKGEGLEALWDRFLIRKVVHGIQNKQSFNDMISKPLNSYSDTVGEALKIKIEEYSKWGREIDDIEVPDNILNIVHVVRSKIESHNKNEDKIEKHLSVSDRRWRKIVRLLRTSAFLNDRKSVDLMDCFLIKDCIWNEIEQAKTVSGFVRDAIQNHGYSLSLNLSDIKEELKDFDEDVISETSFIKEIKVEEPLPVEDKYYEIEWDGNHARHILISDYGSLTYTETSVYLYYKQYNRWDYNNRFTVRKGKRNHILINGKEYKLLTTVREDRKKATKKPHPAVKKEWDRRAKVVLTTTNNLKAQLEHYRSNDLKHLRINLFVDPINADVVETNLNDLGNEIGKLDIEVNRIMHYYENVEDQTEQKEVKQLNIGAES